MSGVGDPGPWKDKKVVGLCSHHSPINCVSLRKDITSSHLSSPTSNQGSSTQSIHIEENA